MTILIELAVAQGGVVTRQQALDAGLTERQIDRRVATGRWESEVAGVYRLIPAGDDTDLLRSAVAGLPDCLVGYGSAARLLGLGEVGESKPTVVVPSSTTHEFPGVQVRRALVLAPSDRAVAHGLPVTSLPRTMVDLAGDVDAEQWAALADQLVADRRLSLAQIISVSDRVCGRGRPGSTTVREYLKERATDGVHSHLERRGKQLLEEYGFEGFETQYPLPWDPQRRFDVAFPDLKVAVEWDSRRWHTTHERMREDRQRDRDAAAHGWVVVRFTYADLANPAAVARELARILHRRRTEGQDLPNR